MRVTGIGGVFFKCTDVEALKHWYAKHLGILSDQYGSMFHWKGTIGQKIPSCTVWSPFSQTTTYFQPSEKNFMVNFRVDDLLGLLKELEKAGIPSVKEVEEYEYGKFGWIVDPEGSKLELWEPIDQELTGTVAGNEGRVKNLQAVFIPSKNSEHLNKWYSSHLGIGSVKPGEDFLMYDVDGNRKHSIQWLPFENIADFMVSYRVDDLDALMEELKKDKIEVRGVLQNRTNGRSIQIVDLEGNIVELFESA